MYLCDHQMLISICYEYVYSAWTYGSIIELTLQSPDLVFELRFISSFLHGFLCPLSFCLYSLLILLSVILSQKIIIMHSFIENFKKLFFVIQFKNFLTALVVGRQ